MDRSSHRSHAYFLSPHLDKHVQAIQTMRDQTLGAKGLLNTDIGPISHAVEYVEDFDCSASGWGREHLTRFQIVVREGCFAPYLYPEQFVPDNTDNTIITLQSEGFFTPTAEKIGLGEWKQDDLSHFVFLYLMLLLRGGDRTQTPHHTPKLRNLFPLAAKNPRDEVINAYSQTTGPFFPSIPRVSSSSDHSAPSLYRPSMSSTDSRPIIDFGPRETLSFILFHHFLSYLGTIEQKVNKNACPLWIPW